MSTVVPIVPASMTNYLKMKTSLDQFGKIVSELTSDENKQLQQIMKQALRMYNAVLSSAEAKKVVVPDQQVNAAMKELKSRFATSEDFETVLEANGLNENSLALSLRNELHCEITLDYVANECQPMSDQQAQDYYYQHLDKFSQPARRKASHILITINDDFEENTAENAAKRMADIAKQLTTDNFGWHATRHSECPTAVNEGQLGLVEQGSLHPELDKVLFEMEAGTISGVLESEIGLHILYCEEIVPMHTVAYPDAKNKIIEQHLLVAKKVKQKQWIAGLFTG